LQSMSINRSYALHADRDFGINASMTFQFVYGFLIIPIHATAVLILLRYSRTLSGAIKTGYFINQIQMFLHDIWSCFLFRVHPILPYPIFYCQGFFCRWFPSISMFIEIIFMINAISLLLFMLLMTHQQILPPSSKFHFSKSIRVIFVATVYIVLCSNGITSFLSRENVENSEGILQSNDLGWLTQRSGSLLIYGDEGHMGPFRNVAFAIMISILIIAPLRIFLVGTSVSFLKKQKVIDSRTMQLKKRIINVLFTQTAIVSFFYVYPLLLIILAMYFSISFLPDIILFGIRLLVVVSIKLQISLQEMVAVLSKCSCFQPISMLNSLGQLYVQVRTNTIFRHVRIIFSILSSLKCIV
ncbi:hypothetical protein PENTCL1PPCAC_16896, partial [Pristionchus entomophagus]